MTTFTKQHTFEFFVAMPISPNLFTIPAEIAAEEEAFRLGNTQFQKFIANLTIPFPFLLLILSAAYLILLGSIYWIYYSVQKKRVRGVTRPSTGGLKPFTCCPCCLSFVDACNCCRMTSLDACLNGLCPQRKSHDCADILFCQACIGRPGHLKKSVKLIRCPFPCQSDYCENTTLCCFYCEFRSAPQLLEET
ncbi:unnamed protein product [Calicophoron daubneyi]|uniref:Uncharacterized protein n=1 Tax=Calicophoron daubneyi TaxID=300641 RepID=A0AAV2TS96_CALDB